jgi:ABC-type cobalamin/Fe3+-siderophores transport system ATPase subunit
MFSVEEITIVAGRQQLLSEVTLQFESNSITAILGANGAGKSTLFKSLLGEYPLTKGHVRLNGKAISLYSLGQLSKMRAYIAQVKTGFFSMLVHEYLQLARLQYPESDKYSENLILTLAEQFQIAHLLMRDVTYLSGGELQLIEFVRAYLQLYQSANMQGKCLLLDEPASALDIKQTRLLYGHLKTFQQQGGTVIIIDHNINAVANIATNLVLIKDGKLLAEGSRKAVFNKTILDTCFETNGQIILNKANDAVENSIYQV